MTPDHGECLKTVTMERPKPCSRVLEVPELSGVVSPDEKVLICARVRERILVGLRRRLPDLAADDVEWMGPVRNDTDKFWFMAGKVTRG